MRDQVPSPEISVGRNVMAVDRNWIRSEPKVFRVNIQALLNGIEESVKNIRENHKELMELAPEFFEGPYLKSVDNWLESYGAEMRARWAFHKSDPKVNG